MKFRIGYGYDAHALVEDRAFMLGGVKITHNKGGLGHSDADVLIHALCDALLGALALGDIGRHFPDNKPEYKDKDSVFFLKKVMELISNENYSISNIDSTIRLQSPKIAPYIENMRTVLAKAMKIDKTQLSIKASTTEKMGFEGREEGVSASVVVLIEKPV